MKKLCFGLVFAGLCGAAGAQEWTQFRGPNATGISAAKGLPTAWTDKDFAFRVQIPGESHSQPVIWGDKLFLTIAEDQGRSRALLCLNKADGQTAWTKKFPMSTFKKHNFNSYSSGSPVVDKDRVIVCFVDPAQFLVLAFDHAGKELWKVNLGTFVSQHGHGASPILYEDKVIVTNDQDGQSFVAALDAKSGKMAWKCQRRPQEQGTAYSTPVILQREGMKPEILLTSQSHGISSIDPKTGAMNWEAKVFDKRSVSSPVVVGNLVLGSCGSGGGGIYLAAVKLGGRGDVTSSHQAYTIKDGAPYVPTPVVSGDRFFMVSDNGAATGVEASTGKVLWTQRVVEGDGFFASPVLADGKVYAVSKKGLCVVFEAADTFKLVSRSPLGEASHSTPCIDGGRIYFKTFTHLVCVGGK